MEISLLLLTFSSDRKWFKFLLLISNKIQIDVPRETYLLLHIRNLKVYGELTFFDVGWDGCYQIK